MKFANSRPGSLPLYPAADYNLRDSNLRIIQQQSQLAQSMDD